MDKLRGISTTITSIVLMTSLVGHACKVTRYCGDEDSVTLKIISPFFGISLIELGSFFTVRDRVNSVQIW